MKPLGTLGLWSWALLFGLVLSLYAAWWQVVPGRRRRRRAAVGRCPACGYDRRGGQSGPCPECGV
ncbi:MAG: hypothetical protein RIB60_07385 [Phycisphaerales bacterium]